jgi:excisionase family DNA binding protein
MSAVEKLLLTPEDAAEALSIGRSKLYELLATGELASIRLGGCRRVPTEAIRHFVAQLSQASAPRARDYLDTG